MKQVISRSGSICVIRDSKGRLWLTRRKKFKHDNRRQRVKARGVKHFPICRLIESEDCRSLILLTPDMNII